jgi:hypothetical protein
MAVVSRPPPLPALPRNMEDELSAAVARFVFEAGGLKNGMYRATQHSNSYLLTPF